MAAVKTILVPVDGSACSLRAQEFAADQQKACKGLSLKVLYIETPVAPSRFISQAMIAEHFAKRSQVALRSARSLIKRKRLDADVQAQMGDPAANIVSFAKKNRCAQIVMGNSGRGFVSKLLLGSVATKVIHLAPCAVTVVK